MKTNTKTTPSIYVGTYYKYNNGSIEGAWLELTNFSDKDEFLLACAELHSDEEDPEFMFQDYEGIPEKYISESSISEDFFEFQSNTAGFDDEKLEAYETFISIFNDDDLSNFKNRFEGAYESEEDFTYQYVEMCSFLSNVPDVVASHFNYESYSRDLFMGGYHFENGFVFRNN